MRLRYLCLASALLVASCGKSVTKNAENKYHDPRDPHSFANAEEVRVRHVTLDLTVSFPTRTLKGNATLAVERLRENAPLILDSRDLKIASMEASGDGIKFAAVPWRAGQTDRILGTPLTVDLPPSATHVRIAYETSPGASALQWLTPEQTMGKKAPFLYTQGQSVHTRSWIPIQDTPGVRVTYSATIRTPKDVLAIMSARNDRTARLTGEYKFDMPQAVPPYLIALAVGALEYRAISARTGVYAEPPMADRAAREFEDLDRMMQVAEKLYGLYQWERYDVLVLPPSFPFGGMENPRLTFVSSTLVAGDKSMVGVISHELAHSWSGNLVTNATWRDFWLNESFTTYLEQRIQEEVYRGERAEMEAVVEHKQMLDELATVPAADQGLYASWKGRDPDEIPAAVAYSKGKLLLRTLEEVWGRDRFDAFLRMYFGNFAFKSVTTGQFVDYLRENLLREDEARAAKVNLDEWLTGSGIPASAAVPKSPALDKAAQSAMEWASGKGPLPDAAKWSLTEWLHFLLAMPADLSKAKMAELDKAFGLTQKSNPEILFQWLLMSVRSKYEPAYPRLESFLLEVGRRKYVKPLYDELAKTPDGKKRGQAIYLKARAGYHPITQTSIDAALR